MAKEASVLSIWPAIKVLPGTVVVDGRPVAAWRVIPRLNPLVAATQTLEGTLARFRAALDTLKAGESSQFILDCMEYDPKTDVKNLVELARKGETAASGFRSLYTDTLCDYLESYCQGAGVPAFRFLVMFSWQQALKPGQAPLDLVALEKEVNRRGQEFMARLQDDGLQIVRLGRDELVRIIDQAVNPTALSTLNEDLFDSPGLSAGGEGDRDLLFRSPIRDVRPKFNALQVGSQYVRTCAFLRPPADGLARGVGELFMKGIPFRFTLFAQGVNQEQMRDLLKKSKKAAGGAITMAGGRDVQEAEEAQSEFDNVIRQHARNEIRFCKFSAYLSVRSSDEEELGRALVDLSGAFSDMAPDEGVYRQVAYWQSSLPLCWNKAGHWLIATTEQTASLYPFYSFASSSPEGGILAGFAPTNEPCWYDPFTKSTENANAFVTGRAGSGKSYLINIIMNRLGVYGHDLSIVDKAKSYKFTCLAYGGDYLELDLNGKWSLNVWDVMDYDESLDKEGLNDINKVGVVNPEKIEVVLNMADLILSDNGQGLPGVNRSLLETDIAATYKRKLKVSKDGKVDQASVPTFSDLAEQIELMLGDKKEQEKDPRGEFAQLRREHLQLLQRATVGNLANLVNKPTTLQSGGSCRVFDISNLPDREDVQGVAMYAITAWLTKHWRKNKVQNRRQMVVIDEMYFFCLFPSGRRLLANIARRSRHMGLSAFFATQQLDDVLKYDETTAVLNNCPTMFLFNQSSAAIERITNILQLGDTEQHILKSLHQVKGEYSQAFWIHGKLRNILTVRPDAAARWLCSSEPLHDVPRINAALEAAAGEPWVALRNLMTTTA